VTHDLAEIRARRLKHEEELASVRWFTPALLAARWRVSETTVRAIPRDALPYLELGTGTKLKRRRYSPEDVAAFETRRSDGQ
jgi:hypothetical protein